jgi:hypothetical protein
VLSATKASPGPTATTGTWPSITPTKSLRNPVKSLLKCVARTSHVTSVFIQTFRTRQTVNDFLGPYLYMIMIYIHYQYILLRNILYSYLYKTKGLALHSLRHLASSKIKSTSVLIKTLCLSTTQASLAWPLFAFVNNFQFNLVLI